MRNGLCSSVKLHTDVNVCVVSNILSGKISLSIHELSVKLLSFHYDPHTAE